MGKKLYFILITLLLISVFSITASAKIGIDLRGGLVLINPTAFNDGILTTDASLNGFGFTNALEHLFTGNAGYNNLPAGTVGSVVSQMFDGSADVNIFLGDSFTIKLKGNGIFCDYDDIVTIEGVDSLYSHLQLAVAYIGAGVSYYFNLSPAFSIYLSGDGGMFLNLGSYYELGTFAEAYDSLLALNLPQGAYSIDFTEPFFGCNAEIGGQFLFTESIGVSFYGGYRYGKMTFTYPNNGAVELKTGGTPPVTTLTKPGVFYTRSDMPNEIDISGPYFGAGLVFYIGAEKANAAGAVAGAGKMTKYEQYGDYYFKQKNFAYALKYYGGAYKLAPNVPLLKKIGMTYYYMKDKVKAMQYLKVYIQKNPNDAQINKWLGAQK